MISKSTAMIRALFRAIQFFSRSRPVPHREIDQDGGADAGGRDQDEDPVREYLMARRAARLRDPGTGDGPRNTLTNRLM